MSLCGNNKALDNLKAKQAELDSLLAGGKDQLSAMESKLNAMKADLESFKPEIPEIESLQDKISKATGLTNPFDKAQSIAEIKEKFGASVPTLEGLLEGLGLNADFLNMTPAELLAQVETQAEADICALIPNVEASPDGTVKEQPAEPKVPEEPPVAPEPTPVIEKDLEELNKKLLTNAYRNSLKYMAAGPKAGAIFKGFGSKRKNKKFYDSTWEELWIEVVEAGGGDHNELRKHSRTKEELRLAQKSLSSKYPDANWDFLKEGQICKETYNLVKDANPHLYADAQDFNTACSEYVVRRKANPNLAKKAATSEV